MQNTSFDSAGAARRLLHEARTGALATLMPDGAPYASLVTVATLPDTSPVLLLSQLALHTENILADPRVSLLLEERRPGDPLEGARASFSGTISKIDDSAAGRRFLARHPTARGYASFGDFAFWRIELTVAHVVAGFGRIADVSADRLRTDITGAAPLIAAEEDAVAHMNKDHADAVELYATRLLGEGAGAWRMIGLDPAGCDLILGETIRRLDFPQRVTRSDALRKVLVELAERARSGGSRGGGSFATD